MKKVAREFVKKEVFSGKYSSGNNSYEYGYFHVVQYKNMYYVVRNADYQIFAVGKELKGYVGDIIYFQYDGVTYGTGNYYLKSDRHGIICKWKTNSEPYITEDADGKATLYFPDGKKYVGKYNDCLWKYYGWDPEYLTAPVEVILPNK